MIAPPQEAHSLWEILAIVVGGTFGSQGVVSLFVKKWMNGTPKRVEAMQKHMQGLATKEDVTRVETKVDGLQEDVTRLRERVARVEGPRR